MNSLDMLTMGDPTAALNTLRTEVALATLATRVMLKGVEADLARAKNSLFSRKRKVARAEALVHTLKVSLAMMEAYSHMLSVTQVVPDGENVVPFNSTLKH